MSNFASTAHYVHGSSEAQQGNPPAHTVGTEFSRQFYFVLTQQPSLAHRFYTDGSSLTHSTGGSGVTVFGQTAINEKIVSLNLDGASAEVENVDAQYSLSGGVTVLVTGHLTVPGKERKAFVQSFFLATQERGYFVLNDTFRYLSDPAKAFAADFAAQDVVSNGSPQQYGAHHEGNGYSSHGARSSASAGLPSQPQHTQPPSAPQPQPSAFQQQANGHAIHAPQVGSAFSSGHSSGDLAQIPSPSPSQTLPPPPPKPSAPSVAPTPTPAQQTPTAPSQEPSTEQEPEQSSSQQEQEQEAPQDQGPSTDQLVPQPPVDQNRPPVKPQRRPSAPAPQEADKKGSAQPQSSAASSTPSAPRSYADLLKNAEAANAPSGSTPSSGRPQTPSRPSTAAPSPAAQSPSPAVPAPPKASGNRTQGRNAPAAAAAGSASSDTSGRGEQAGGNFPALDRPALRPAGSDGPPPARPPYAAPGRGVQGYRDDDSSKKAVYVRNIPQDATSDEIRELFSQFGTVKSGNGAITLKHNGNNNSFAYVDFMDVASAQACVDAKDVMLKDNILIITPKRANYGGSRGGGRFGGRGDGRGAGGYSRGRGGDRGGFHGRGSSGSFSDNTQHAGGDKPQGDRSQSGRPQNAGGPGAPRGRGGRDGGRGGRGRGGARPQPAASSSSHTPEVAPSTAE